MAKGITYFCTDADGNVYNRYSVGHTAPRFVVATIARPKGGKASKAGLSYSSKPHLNAGTWPYTSYDGSPWTSESVAVRAYPGKHTVEPQA